MNQLTASRRIISEFAKALHQARQTADIQTLKEIVGAAQNQSTQVDKSITEREWNSLSNFLRSIDKLDQSLWFLLESQIELWHKTDKSKPLHEFLFMTQEEFNQIHLGQKA